MSMETFIGNHIFTIRVPKIFEGYSKTNKICKSMYNQTENGMATLIAPVLYALLRYCDILDNISKGAIGRRVGKAGVVEYYDEKKNVMQTAIYSVEDGRFYVQTYSSSYELCQENGQPLQYCVRTSTHSPRNAQSGALLFMAMLPITILDKEFQTYFKKFQTAKGINDWDALTEAGYVLCDNLYQRISLAEKLGFDGLPVDVPVSGEISLFLEENMADFFPTEILAGKFNTIPATNSMYHKRGDGIVSKEELVGKYKFEERTFSPKEKRLIPEIKPYYQVPERVVRCCALMEATTNSSSPVRNFIFRGEAGVGKTEACMAIASALGLPYMHMTCHGAMELSNLLSYYVPCTQNTAGTELGYPSLEHFLYDPPSAYQTLTGIYDTEVTPQQAYEEFIRFAELNGKSMVSKGEKQFEFVETPLITAMKRGYVCEIQEVSALKPDVLLGLNSLLDQCGDVLLENGELIKRHPDTVIIMTTNSSYEGCKKLNQSVLSRAKIVTFPDLTEKDYYNRGLAITSCKDTAMIKRMAQAMVKIKKYCQENFITDGSCGLREFILWIQTFMLCQDVLEAAKETILESVSEDSEICQAIFDACLKLYFKQEPQRV